MSIMELMMATEIYFEDDIHSHLEFWVQKGVLRKLIDVDASILYELIIYQPTSGGMNDNEDEDDDKEEEEESKSGKDIFQQFIELGGSAHHMSGMSGNELKMREEVAKKEKEEISFAILGHLSSSSSSSSPIGSILNFVKIFLIEKGGVGSVGDKDIMKVIRVLFFSFMFYFLINCFFLY